MKLIPLRWITHNQMDLHVEQAGDADLLYPYRHLQDGEPGLEIAQQLTRDRSIIVYYPWCHTYEGQENSNYAAQAREGAMVEHFQARSDIVAWEGRTTKYWMDPQKISAHSVAGMIVTNLSAVRRHDISRMVLLDYLDKRMEGFQMQVLALLEQWLPEFIFLLNGRPALRLKNTYGRMVESLGAIYQLSPSEAIEEFPDASSRWDIFDAYRLDEAGRETARALASLAGSWYLEGRYRQDGLHHHRKAESGQLEAEGAPTPA